MLYASLRESRRRLFPGRKVMRERLERLHQSLVAVEPLLQLRAVAHAHHGIHQHRRRVFPSSTTDAFDNTYPLRWIPAQVVGESLPVLVTTAALPRGLRAQKSQVHAPLLSGLRLAVGKPDGQLDVAGRDAVQDLEQAVQLGRGV